MRLLYFYKLFLILLFKTATSNEIDNKDEMISHFSWEIENWIKTGNESETFKYLLDSLAVSTSLQRNDWRSFTDQKSTAICIICESILKTFITFRRKGMSADDIRSKVVKLCTQLNFQTERVCKGAITLNLPTILYIVDAKPNLTASTICGVILESKSCPLINDEYNWTVNIDSSPPKLIHAEDTEETIDIIQITDIHYDPNYEPNSDSNCNEPICCRKEQNQTSDKTAGYWGDYNYCDTPWHAMVDALDHIRFTHQDISYVYFTGDVIDHGIWETSIEKNIESLNSSYYQIYKTFGTIPVYPILGNHESHPLNLFAPKTISNNEISTQWLYNMLANLWIKFGWLPESTRSTILQGGYYTLSPKKGFRIIVLNNNVCYCYNWWLWYEPKDPDGQLQWLADTLLQAEKNAEFVHILAHIPPAHEHCQSTWKREYLKIINRFTHIIRAQFNGHTHNDELQLFYSNNITTKVDNVAWNGGSLTAYSNLNPNYKLYVVDNKNYAVKDMENWMYNLTLANDNIAQRPLWYKSYSFKEEYNITDLSYNSLHTWFSRLTYDDDLLSRYYRNFFKHAEPSLTKECNKKCMKAYLCRIVASLQDHTIFCS